MSDTIHSGNIIARLRKSHGLSQSELARDLGVSRQYLSEIENGREPGMELLRAAAAKFEVPAALFLLGESNGNDPITKSLRQILQLVLKAAEKATA
jgi:transcriptional regulator with XRE-family HTH domain